MEKNKKIIIRILIALGAIALIVGSFFVGYFSTRKYNGQDGRNPPVAFLNREWKVDLPTDSVCTYMVTGEGWDRGWGYFKFVYEQEPTAFLSKFSSQKNAEFESAFTERMGWSLSKNSPDIEEGIDEELSPDFTNEYLWLYRWEDKLQEIRTTFPATDDRFSYELYMVYVATQKSLYVVYK